MLITEREREKEIVGRKKDMALLASSSDNVKIWRFDGSRVDLQAQSVSAPERTLCVRWNHTNQVVGAGTTEGNINLQHVTTAQILSTLSLRQNGIHGSVKDLAFSSNSRYLAAAAGSGVHVWDLKRRTVKASLQGHSGTVACVGFHVDGQILSGDSHGVLKVWDMNGSGSTQSMRREREVALNCLAVSPSLQVACGYGDGGIVMWDAGVGKATTEFQQLHNSTVLSVAMSPKNSRLVVTAGDDGYVNLVDTSSPSNSRPSASIKTGEDLTALSFQENAIHSAVGTRTGNILVYDWRNLAKPLCVVPAHDPAPVLSLAFQVPKAKPTDTAGSVSSLGMGSVDKRSEDGNSIGQSYQKYVSDPNGDRKHSTPKKVATPQRQEIPDTLSREEVSELSFVSTGSINSAGRPSKSSLSKPIGSSTPQTSRRVHIDRDENFSRRTTGPGNVLYNSGAKISDNSLPAVGSPLGSAEGVNSSIPGAEDGFDDLRRHVDPATSQELQDMYQLLRYRYCILIV